MKSKAMQPFGIHVGYLVLALVLATAAGEVPAREMLKIDGMISGDILEIVGGRELKERRSHIWMSRSGMIVETKGTPGKLPHLLYLYNSQEDRSWIVSPEGKRYCEMPEDDDSDDFAGGMLSTKPCLGFEGHQLKEVEWSGQLVEVWQCQREGKDLARHYYSRDLGIVVKEEANDGVVRELRNINLDDISVSDRLTGVTKEFRPLKDYRSVTVNEFFFAKRPLEKYLD